MQEFIATKSFWKFKVVYLFILLSTSLLQMADSVIKPPENALSLLIDKAENRSKLGSIGTKYDAMQTYIDNLGQDIDAIETYIQELKDQEDLGFDIGSAITTLGFQKSTLNIDFGFYTSMKSCYMRKLYDDLWKFSLKIVNAAMEIEAKVENHEEVADEKMNNRKAADDGSQYSMSEITDMLAIAEKNLFELSSDIAQFDQLITNARDKEKRGFEIGNLIMNLTSQKSSLETDYKTSILKLKQFLNNNERFADKCLRRVVRISSEVETSDKEETGDEQVDNDVVNGE